MGLLEIGGFALQIIWYLHQSILLLFIDERRPDFVEMLIHHFATLSLLICSYLTGYWRVGLLVVYCFDACDIALQINKLFRFFDNSHPLPEVLAYLVFPPLPIIWMYFRVYFFIKKVFHASVIESVGKIPFRRCDGVVFFTALLFLLLLLNIYWLYLIMLTAIKHVVYGEDLDDEREPMAVTRADSTATRSKSKTLLTKNSNSSENLSANANANGNANGNGNGNDNGGNNTGNAKEVRKRK